MASEASTRTISWADHVERSRFVLALDKLKGFLEENAGGMSMIDQIKLVAKSAGLGWPLNAGCQHKAYAYHMYYKAFSKEVPSSSEEGLLERAIAIISGETLVKTKAVAAAKPKVEVEAEKASVPLDEMVQRAINKSNAGDPNSTRRQEVVLSFMPPHRREIVQAYLGGMTTTSIAYAMGKDEKHVSRVIADYKRAMALGSK